MLEIGLMVGGVVCAVASFAMLEVYRVSMTAQQLVAMQSQLDALTQEVSRLRLTIEENEKDHFVMRQMLDDAVISCQHYRKSNGSL